MKTADDSIQSKFFDQERYRFSHEKMQHQLPQHRLELAQIKKKLRVSPPKTILDFGSGNGRLTIFLLKSGFNVYAVDISTKSLESLAQFYKKNKTKSWGTLHTSTAIPNNILFDAVLGCDILHHIPISPYLKKFHKIVKPGGLLIFSEPNAWHLFWYIYYLLFVSWEIEKGILNCTMANLRKEFTKAGFHHFRIEGHGLLPTPLFNFLPSVSSFNVWLGNLPILRNVAFRFIISAKK